MKSIVVSIKTYELKEREEGYSKDIIPRINGRARARMDHKMPESFKALLRIVSFTAAKTSRMFEVSVACVR